MQRIGSYLYNLRRGMRYLILCRSVQKIIPGSGMRSHAQPPRPVACRAARGHWAHVLSLTTSQRARDRDELSTVSQSS